MGRILGIDYGKKRVGLAITDTLKIIAKGLTTVRAHDLMHYLDDLFQKEDIECVVVGYPKTLRNEPSEALNYINPFLKHLQKKFPDLKIELMDERFTSKMAFNSMIVGGLKKKDRQNKALIDEISAAIILKSYLDQLSYRK